ncbi:MAG TPA: GNAT family N-acetyltransferase [Rhizomicrobium sp.]|nr:GNAT family N-acetyltransferase [Rhizomicrobium sp.]
MTIAVRLMGPEDYESFRALRLESLHELPANFAADPDQEAAMPKEEWLRRLASASSFGGFIDGRLSGMVVFSRPSRPKLAHTGDIGAMYVRASAQGTGLADALMTALLKHAATVVEQVQLTVNAENARAIRFYQRHGFRQIGIIPRSLHIGDRYYDDMLMFRSVSPGG